jgi:activator of 2-hydroxyglutaryl-CoA dehydratase
VPLASRCSVHCKSDITHKLNRNEARPEDILHTLHDSMANKVIALLEKGVQAPKRVLLIGGVTHNDAMLAALRERNCRTPSLSSCRRVPGSRPGARPCSPATTA